MSSKWPIQPSIHLSLSFLSICAEDITVFRRTSQNLDDQNPAAHLSFDLAQVTTWDNDWLVKLHTFKTKLTLHQHRAEAELSPIVMDGCSFKEAPCLEPPLGLKLTRASYIQSIAKDTGKIVDSIYCASK